MVRFVLVGGGTAFGYFLLLLAADAYALPPLLSHPAAYVLAFLVAYGLQRGWTFAGAASHRHALPRYLATQLFCAAVAGLLGHAMHAADWPPLPAALLVTVAASVISFFLSSCWAFRPPASRTPTPALRP